ncbi:MAG: hypothetical protein ACLQQ4_01670 [Bacteroidia bacterium]
MRNFNKQAKALQREQAASAEKKEAVGAKVTDATQNLAKEGQEPVAPEAAKPFAEVKKEWHDTIKKFATYFYEQSGGFQPMLFLLIKEGSEYRQEVSVIVLTSDRDKDMLGARIKKACKERDVVSFCTVFEAWTVDRRIGESADVKVSEQQDRKEVIVITCETREERTTTVYELKDGKANYVKEDVENADSDTVTTGRFGNVLFGSKKA